MEVLKTIQTGDDGALDLGDSRRGGLRSGWLWALMKRKSQQDVANTLDVGCQDLKGVPRCVHGFWLEQREGWSGID